MGWVSPDGFLDPSSGWTTEENAYDDNEGTLANNVWSNWGDYLELTLSSSISCDKVQIYIADVSPSPPYNRFNPDIDIDVFWGGSYHNIFSGTVTKDTWVEKAIGSIETVDKAQVKSNTVQYHTRLYEFDFWEVEVVPPTYIPKVIMVQCSPMAKKNGIYRGLKNLWLPTPPVPKVIMVQ